MLLKRIVPIILLILFYSCSVSKLAKVESDKGQPTSQGYVYENDTIKITYHFWSNKGSMLFDVYNKLNVPLYIDWKTSAFIWNDKMYPYWADAAITNTGTVYSPFKYYSGGVSVSNSKSVHPERITVVAPKSMSQKRSWTLCDTYNDFAEGIYNNNTSPVKFRNYLIVSTNEKFDANVSTIDQHFYVSSVKKMKASKIPDFATDNAFYVQQTGSEASKEYLNKHK